MSTIKQYLTDPKTLHGSATIMEIIPGEKPVVRLDRTWFHAQGGGQKADRGRIHTANVLHVAHNENKGVDHYVDSLDGLTAGMTVAVEVDAPGRQENARWHTAGHHLAGAVERLYPELKAVSGHQWPGEGRVEFEGARPVESVSADDINARLKADITAALPVVLQGDPFGGREIKIGDYPAIPCGGTHLENLAQLGATVVKSVKAKNGRIRLSYETVGP